MSDEVMACAGDGGSTLAAVDWTVIKCTSSGRTDLRNLGEARTHAGAVSIGFHQRADAPRANQDDLLRGGPIAHAFSCASSARRRDAGVFSRCSIASCRAVRVRRSPRSPLPVRICAARSWRRPSQSAQSAFTARGHSRSPGKRGTDTGDTRWTAAERGGSRPGAARSRWFVRGRPCPSCCQRRIRASSCS